MLNPVMQKFKVDTLLNLGCKRWTKSGLDRIYINESELHQILGAEANYYSTNSLKNCKYYYDLVADTYGYKHYEGCADLHDVIFRAIDEYIMAKYNAHKIAKAVAEAEREVTLDDINDALGF